MANAGLIVIALLGGALLILLLVGMALLGWGLWQVERSIATHGKQLTGHAAEMKTGLDAAKSSLASIRTDMSRQQDQSLKSTQELLQGHAQAMHGAIAKINAEALEAASVRGLQASARMEKVAVALQKLLLTVDPQPENSFGPEDYGPDDRTIYGSVSDVARGDAQADAEDQQDTFTFG